MSRNYDNWEKLVGAVLRREKDRQLAYCESFSTSYSSDFSSRFSFDYGVEDADFSGDVHAPADIDNQMDDAESKDWDCGFEFFNRKNLPVCSGSRQRFDPLDPSSQEILFFRDVMAIEYEELKEATKNFRPNTLLGGEAFCPVFKGWLHEHHLTAVKPGTGIAVSVKKISMDESYPGRKEWMNEIIYLSELRHLNLVKLIGYNFETDSKFLVYEFMPKGSLDIHLFTRGDQSLPWITRMKVALGAASALAFLHGLEIPVIHRDFKCRNILLDSDFNPKLSGFTIARDGPTSGLSHVQTAVMGTHGYAAPEYIETGNLTTSCDVYSFGVVLIELISGLRVIDTNQPAMQTNLMEWVKPHLGNKRRLLRIMDRRLGGEFPRKEAYEVARIGLQCTSADPKSRPRMQEVVAALQEL